MLLDEEAIQKLESEKGQREARKASLVLVGDRRIQVVEGRCWMSADLKRCGVERPPSAIGPEYVFSPTGYVRPPLDLTAHWELQIEGETTPAKIEFIVKGARQGWYYLEGPGTEALYLPC